MKATWVRTFLVLGFLGLLLGLLFKYMLPPDLDEIELTDELNPIVAEKKDELIQLANDKGIPSRLSLRRGSGL